MEPAGLLPYSQGLSLAPILSQTHPLQTSPLYFPEIHSVIFLPSTSMSSEWCLPLRFSNQNTVVISHLSHACYNPAHLMLDFIILIIFDEAYKFYSRYTGETNPKIITHQICLLLTFCSLLGQLSQYSD